MTDLIERERIDKLASLWRSARFSKLFSPPVLLIAFLRCASTTDVAEPASLQATTVGGNKFVALVVGARTTVNVTVRNSRGEVVQPVAAYSFLSRAPDVVAVDQSGMVMAEKISATWILVRLSIQNRVLSDSVQVAVIEPTNE